MRLGFSFILLTIATFSFGQKWVGIGLGGHLTDVDFTNSQGVKDSRIKGVPSTYASFYLLFDLGTVKRMDQPKSALALEVGYKRSNSKNTESPTLETWTMDNLSTSLAFRRFFQSKRTVDPYLGAGVNLDVLLGATQQEGFSQYDLTQDLRTLNLSAIAEAGISYFISREVYGILGTTYLRGLSNLEKADGQTVRINGFKVGVSVFFQLK